MKTAVYVNCPYCKLRQVVWVPMTQGFVRPVIQICDPYLGCDKSFAVSVKWLHESKVFKLKESK